MLKEYYNNFFTTVLIYNIILILLSINVDKPGILVPDASLSKQTRAKWLLEICEEHVNKYVLNKDELASLIAQTTELEQGSLPFPASWW